MIRIPINYKPTVEEVEKYIRRWNENEDANNKELALNKLFNMLCPENKDIKDILIKCSTLNDFYSTNIFDIHSVAQHILKLRIDERLREGDINLVKDIANVKVGNPPKNRTFYSFATKYCSHHQPKLYAIYDNYVEKVLVDLNKKERGASFSSFTLEDLRDYKNFMRVIRDFQNHFGLNQFTLKQMDQYLWQLGKKYFIKVVNVKTFTEKYIDYFENDFSLNTASYYDFFDSDIFPNDCRKLGFKMDCGHSFIETCGQEAWHSARDLSSIIGEITDVIVLGSGIFSKWRFFNHWSYGHATAEDQKWFLTILYRIKELAS